MSGLAGTADIASVELGNLLRNGQSQSGPFVFMGSVSLEKLFKYVGEGIFVHTGSLIPQINLESILGLDQTDVDQSSFRGVFYPVV